MTYIPENPNGQATMADSAPVVIASDQSTITVSNPIEATLLGAVTETAPTTDTASSGINGRVQRVAQNLTTISGKLPATLGQKVAAASMSVTLASDQTAISVADSNLGTLIGAVNEATPANETISSGLNGRLKYLTQLFRSLTGADNETAPSTDTAASGINGRLQRVAQNVSSVSSKLPTTLGQKTSAASLAVTIASDQSAVNVAASNTDFLLGPVNEAAASTDTISSGINGRLQRIAQNITTTSGQLGIVTETAPASDTASSGLNGRLQRIAQRLTSLIAQLPATLGAKTTANSMAVNIASDQTVPVSIAGTVPVSVAGTVATSVADGSNVAIGAKADAVATTATGTFSLIALTKWIASKMAMATDSDNAVQTNNKILPGGGVAEDIESPTAYTAGDAAMFRFDKTNGALKTTIGDLNSVADSITFSERSLNPSLEITRPADTIAYSPYDCISGSTSSTPLFSFSNVSLGSTTSSGVGSLTYDGGGWITGLKFSTEDNGLIGKNLTLLLFDNSLSANCVDNTRFSESYLGSKSKVCKIEIPNIAYAFSYSAADTPTLLEVNLMNLMIPFKNTGTSFKAVLCTRDAFTPASAAKYYLQLIISANK